MGGLNPGDFISPDYLAQIRELHARQGQWGAGGYKYAETIMGLARKVEASTILDYGCGRGTLKQHIVGWPVVEYDPGIVGKDELPSPADVVACTDVLEHIEHDRIGVVLDHLCGLTQRVCFAVVSMRKANALLPDGRNAHLIVRGTKWWLAYLKTKDWSVEEIRRSEDQLVVSMWK